MGKWETALFSKTAPEEKYLRSIQLISTAISVTSINTSKWLNPIK